MTGSGFSEGVEIPTRGKWPGSIASYRLVKPHIKPHIWNLLSVIGLTFIAVIIAEIILAIIFKQTVTDKVLNEVAGLVAGAFMQAALITMYFKILHNDEYELKEIATYAYKRMFKMFGLLIVMYVLLIVAFVLFVVPFLILLPRLYMAPYFLIYNDSTVSEAIAASWHLTKGHSVEVYGIIILDFLIALVAITIIGIPFSIYWWLINTGSFVLLTMYLAQPKPTNKAKKKTGPKSVAKKAAA